MSATLKHQVSRADFPCATTLGSSSLMTRTIATSLVSTSIAALALATSASGSYDRTPPQTIITSSPPAEVTSTSATVAFISSESLSKFSCRLDYGTWVRCSSPKTFSSLAVGTHVVRVRARDRAGNVDPTPASAGWTVMSPAPAPAPTPSGCSSSATFCAMYESSWTAWDGFNGSPNGGIGNWGYGYANSYFSFAGDPVAEGSRSFKATVDGGAAAGGQSGQRTLVQNWPHDTPSANKSRGYQGSEAWYRTRLYFPVDFDPAPGAWNWLIEWHNWPDHACCANIAFTVVTDATDGGPSGGERLSVRVLGGGDASHPVDNLNIGDSAPATFRRDWYPGPNIQRGHWYDILVHAKWDYTAAGLVEYWLDGVKTITYNGPTLFWYADNNPNFAGASAGPGQSYWMQGYYRGSGSSIESVYHDAATIGPTLASVF